MDTAALEPFVALVVGVGAARAADAEAPLAFFPFSFLGSALYAVEKLGRASWARGHSYCRTNLDTELRAWV